MKYAIVGRTCSGKDAMIALLEARGLKLAKSSTTRPCRGPEDTRYEFLSAAESDAVPADRKLVPTVIGGYEYFHDKARVEDADMLLLDPPGLYALLEAYPGEAIEVVYMAADRDVRRSRAESRGTLEAFDVRDPDEGPRFDEFEAGIDVDTAEPLWIRIRNCTAVHRVSNGLDDPAGLAGIADQLARWMTARKRLEVIARRTADLGSISVDENGLFALPMEDGTVLHVPASVFAGIASYNEAAVGRLMLAWLGREPHIYLDKPDS